MIRYNPCELFDAILEEANEKFAKIGMRNNLHYYKNNIFYNGVPIDKAENCDEFEMVARHFSGPQEAGHHSGAGRRPGLKIQRPASLP
ncbi:MAG: hypothetical protein PHU77_01375 [Simplicispira sp.]|nr:hypothetical protein [Simplicispira sp.]